MKTVFESLKPGIFCWQNCDPDVRKDMETFLSKVAVPEVCRLRVQEVF